MAFRSIAHVRNEIYKSTWIDRTFVGNNHYDTSQTCKFGKEADLGIKSKYTMHTYFEHVFEHVQRMTHRFKFCFFGYTPELLFVISILASKRLL